MKVIISKTPIKIIFALITINIGIFGQNYDIQYVNKSPLFATSSILQDYDSDDDLDIIITRRTATTDKAAASVEWLENDGTGQFPRNTLFENVNYPVDLDIGDFNNDGNIDYIISDNYINSSLGSVVLAIKQLDGSFNLSLLDDSISTDQSAVADFDNNGNLDVVSVGFGRDRVSVYWNDGAANFTKQEMVDSVRQVEIVEIDDIDNDGDIDIIYGGGGLDGFKILYNNGIGVFDSSQTLFMNNGQYSNAKRGMTIADLNVDGLKDILAYSGVGFGGLYFLNGASNFSSSLIDIDGIDLGGDILVADIDGNGLNDIIRQNSGDDYVSILYQESSMNFRVEIIELNWDNKGPGQMSLGDLDNDGDTDLVFPENGNVDGDLSWFENIDGSLYRHYLYSEIEAVRVPIIGDLDNDGDMDIVVTAGDDGAKSEEDEIIWYENMGDNKFIENRIDDDFSAPSDVKLGDLDGDGFKDIVATSFEDSNLVWYKKNGPGWIKSLVDNNLINPLGCDVADIDMDGDLDITLCLYGENKIIWYSNNGSGMFSRQEIDDTNIKPQAVRAVDFNNDNETDLAVVSSDSNNTVTVYINDGNENFTGNVISINQFSYTLDIGDWDNNGTTDIIVGFDKGSVLGDENRDIAVFMNDGLANFTDSTLVVLQERTTTLKLVDVDNDADLDIVFGAGSSGIFPLRLAKNENGLVKEIKEITEKSVRAYGIDAADINGDGVVDIVASDQVNSTNNLLLLVGNLTTKVEDDLTTQLPVKINLHQNYPNPFNPSTNINFDINETNHVSLIIFDVLGRKVNTLVNGIKQSGSYQIQWNGQNQNGTILPSGIYIMQLNSNGVQISKSMLMLK